MALTGRIGCRSYSKQSHIWSLILELGRSDHGTILHIVTEAFFFLFPWLTRDAVIRYGGCMQVMSQITQCEGDRLHVKLCIIGEKKGKERTVTVFMPSITAP